MSQIPFSPPQVQAALKNPTRFPDQKLQQYAKGQQPTGQVSPMMAQEEMATRNQERQAFQRQQAMQNNPENSPTVFQQKDMQLQQAMQALQQKEQQLGLAGAMLAKKQQDLAAREQGIAALPVNPNMFTAMDGGIVFSGGGGVEGYARRGLVAPDLGAFNEDRPSYKYDEESRRKSKEDLEDEDIVERLRAPGTTLSGIASTSILSEEARERIKQRRIKELAEQYDKYKQGIAGLDEEAAAAIRGKPADLWRGIAAGLPTETRGVRLAGLMAGLAKGVAGERGRAEERDTKAAMYLAEAKRKRAEAEFAEERGRSDLAKKAADEEQALLNLAYGREKDVASTTLEGEKAAATYLGNRDKLEAAQQARARANELKEQQLKINEALAQGRISQMQAQAQNAAIAQELRVLGLQNQTLQAQTQLSGAYAAAQDRVNKSLENDSTYYRVSSNIDKLMRKEKLTPEEDKRLDTLLNQRQQLVDNKMKEYGLDRFPTPGAKPSQPAKPLPTEVSVGGKSYKRPAGFSDEQWSQYIKDSGAK